MTTRVDDLGIWVDLGTITPSNVWQNVPNPTTLNQQVFRLNWSADFDLVSSFCYLRFLFQVAGQQVVSQKWKKVYPKLEREIISLDLDPVFLYQNPVRYVEVIKKSKYYRLGSIVDDFQYALSVEEFIPYPQQLNEAKGETVIKEAVKKALAESANELPPEALPPFL